MARRGARRRRCPSVTYVATAQVEESAHIASLALQLVRPGLVSASEIERIHDLIHHHYQ